MLTTKSFPKVTVGLPTYNGCVTLKQAINAVLQQDYLNIELVISDNASTNNQTQVICEEFSRKDKRIKYIRQKYNLGLAANYVEVLKNSSGELFMWLADDDWIDSSYISECVKALLEDDELSLAAGKVKYYPKNGPAYEGRKINHLQSSGLIRLLDYYFRLRDNGSFYGIMRRKDLNNTILLNVMGYDAFILAVIAFLGKIKVIESTLIHRRLGGTSDNWEKIAVTLSLPKFEGLFPVLTIAINAFEDISWRVPVFSKLGNFRRHIIAVYVFLIIIFMKSAPLLIMESSKNVLKFCFGEKCVKNTGFFIKKLLRVNSDALL